jgi:biopolymer transport protein ExbD
MLDIPKKRHKHFDLTPLVDIVFNLLLFFILSYQISEYNRIEVSLPESNIVSSKENFLNIYIKSDNEIYLEKEKVSLENLEKKLFVVDKKKSININSDKKVSVEILVKVIEKIKESGFEKFNIITKYKK